MSSYLVTINKDIIKNTEMIRVYDEKFMNEDDTTILEEEVENGGTDWCDVSADIVLEEYSYYPGTAQELIQEVSKEYGINPRFVNVYEVKNKIVE